MATSLVYDEEAQQELKRQRARATISSVIISFLVIVLLGLILAFVLIPGILVNETDIITYQAAAVEDNEIEQKQLNPAVQRKPSAPSSAMAKVIAANTTSPTAIPVPEVVVDVESVDFGDGDDFGAGWGSGSGSGSGGGGTTFFGQPSTGERVAFVIDYSASMRANDRVGIMKEELEKSISGLNGGMKYQMIFFAGPVWVAGSEVKDKNAKDVNFIEDENGTVYEWRTSGGAHNWKPRGKEQKAEWLTANKVQLRESQKVVKNTPLVWGTRWKYALEMAIDMEPAPQVVYFMTDGSTGGEAMKIARTVGAKASSRGIKINCVAMMEPKAHEAMKELAKRTGGQFSVVNKDGKHVPVSLD
ncbi:MAG: hypothetical protein Q7Q71_03960 [Verrucomicrobiota bacterium JB023]|nr:hypothetical protein [Verrucomicrobiota bacterium JB023]